MFFPRSVCSNFVFVFFSSPLVRYVYPLIARNTFRLAVIVVIYYWFCSPITDDLDADTWNMCLCVIFFFTSLFLEMFLFFIWFVIVPSASWLFTLFFLFNELLSINRCSWLDIVIVGLGQWSWSIFDFHHNKIADWIRRNVPIYLFIWYRVKSKDESNLGGVLNCLKWSPCSSVFHLLLSSFQSLYFCCEMNSNLYNVKALQIHDDRMQLFLWNYLEDWSMRCSSKYSNDSQARVIPKPIWSLSNWLWK